MNRDDDAEILAAARAGFLDEANDMLAQFEQALLVMETAPDDDENLNAAFRAAHTIKGTAGLFGCDAVVLFTHEVETLLGHFRRARATGLPYDGALKSALRVALVSPQFVYRLQPAKGVETLTAAAVLPAVGRGPAGSRLARRGYPSFPQARSTSAAPAAAATPTSGTRKRKRRKDKPKKPNRRCSTARNLFQIVV
jgi:two-component system chemotaxis sensor kinase CheA